MSRKTTPRETEKPKKLTRAQKKEIDAVIRKYKGDGKPRTAQATIPYEAIYPDGVCRIDRRTFSKCIAFEDISYQLAQPEARTAIFEHLCDLYNYVDASIHVQLSFLNRKVDPVQYAKSFEIAPQGDDFDDIRAEYTAILQKQLASGNNGIVKTKYLTFTIDADSLKTARARLTRIGLDLLGYFKTMGCVAHVMDGRERLEVLHGIFHPDGEPFRFDWDWLAPSGLSTKDFVAPSSLCFGTAKTFGLGGKYGAVSFLQQLPQDEQGRQGVDGAAFPCGLPDNPHHAGKALPQPGLGRVADGFPAQMDGHYLWAEEPADIPRLTEDVPNRSKRMKTLGNAVSPPQVFPILKYIADIETGRCPMGGEEP